MLPDVTAAAWAEQQVARVRDDPAGRLALMERCYHGPFGRAPRHLPFRRAASSFMRWQLRRGVLRPATGSPWWRAVNERILRDGCEAVALSGGLSGPASSRTAAQWLAFARRPTAQAWYRAHNGSVVAAYLENRDLAEAENEPERFFMNVILCRVLYTHALVAAPRLSLSRLRALAPLLGDPRLGMTGIFLQLSRVLPDLYPLRGSVRYYLSKEHGFGRLVDFGMIVPRLPQIYAWSAHELSEPGLLDCVRDGALTYAWPFEDRHVWQPPSSLAIPMIQRILPPYAAGVTIEKTPMGIRDLPLTTISGEATTLGAGGPFAGKALLVVNVASKCGLTPQYTGLERLQERYGAEGFSVVGFPCNQFGGQEPGTPEEIQTFCSTTYGVSFPLFEKVDVNGEGRHPLYRALTEAADADGEAGDVKWNFEKFLISTDGQVLGRFRPMTDPEDEVLVKAIEAALPA